MLATVSRWRGCAVPLLFVSRQFVSTTIRLHYNSSPLLFVSTTFRVHKIRLQQFVSITIRLHYYSDQLQFYYIYMNVHVDIIYVHVDAINNAGKNSYGGSFVSN